MAAFKIPVISGKDSLSSTYRGKDLPRGKAGGTVIKIPPVLCISVFGRIPNASKTVTADFKRECSTIILVGKQDIEAMAGSVYLDTCHPELDSGSVPKIDLATTAKVFYAIHKGIISGQILSAHDISEGGLITTLFEMCVGGDMGASVILSEAKNLHSDYFLFNETAGCFLAEVKNETVAKRLFTNVPYVIIGKTTIEKKISVEKLFTTDLLELKKVWQEPMKKYFP